MFEPDTVLALKEPKSTEDNPFPYDKVRVVGPSPIQHAGIKSEWLGGEAQGVIIEPLTAFGGNLDEPYGRLQVLYDIEFVPDHTAPIVPTVQIITPALAGPSPEEVFKAAREDTHIDRRVPEEQESRSPLDDGPLVTAEEQAVIDAKKEEIRARA